MNKRPLRFFAWALATSMMLSACAPQGETRTESAAPTASAAPEEKPRLEDDFYGAINYDWLQDNPIPDDQLAVGHMMDNALRVDENLRKDLKELLESPAVEEDSPRGEMLRYYRKALDFETIDAQGSEPLMPHLAKIEAVQDARGLNEAIISWTEENGAQSIPLSFYMQPDMMEATKKSITLYTPPLLFNDKSYYEEGNETGAQMMALYAQNRTELLTALGLEEETAAKKVENAMAVDARFAQYELSAEEKSNFAAQYNPVSREEIREKYSGAIDVMAMLDAILPTKVDTVIVPNAKLLENLPAILNLGDIQEIKDWMYVKTVTSNVDFLSEDLRQISTRYSDAIMGTISGPDAREEDAFYNTNTLFNFVIGELYAEKYFSPEAKADVENMVHEIIDTYRRRIENNDWLGEETKAQAIKKLDTMVVKIGYPEALPSHFVLMKVDESKSYLDNYLNLVYGKFHHDLSKFEEPVDRQEWALPPQMVEAMYSPMKNDITFPAGILQAPTYSLDQSATENYAGIGTIIAHEISHAFDTNGSHYDELGNLKDWWTAEDYAEFETRAQALVDAFEGLDYMGGQVNGALTVSENVADLGGLSAALEKVQSLPDGDMNDFFTHYAISWCRKERPEIAGILLQTDVHAPAKWRVNAQVVNFGPFFDAFSIKEGDGMWLAPEDGISIW